MKDRLVNLAGAAVALLLLSWVLGFGPSQPAPRASRPSSHDDGPAGLHALYLWLQGAEIPVERLRKRYTELDALAPGTGHVLVVAESMAWSVRPAEQGALSDWIDRGNQVLLLGALGRSKGRRARDEILMKALDLQPRFLSLVEKEGEHLGRLRDSCRGDALVRGTITGPQRRLRPASARAHPVLTGVREVLVKTPALGDGYFSVLEYQDQPRHWHPLLCDPQLRLPVLTVFRLGNGRIWSLEYGEAFDNTNLGRGDNAVLLGNLLAFALGPRGRVVFDDMHQGDSELYDPAAFFGDRRLHGTIAFLFGIWLLWLFGYSSRFAPPVTAPATVTSRDFMRAVGRFHARYLRPLETARALFHHFFNDVRRRYRLPTTGAAAWDALARSPGALDGDVRQLQAWHQRIKRGQDVDLPRLRNLILKVQDSLT